jgi:hypothetical protein
MLQLQNNNNNNNNNNLQKGESFAILQLQKRIEDKGRKNI